MNRIGFWNVHNNTNSQLIAEFCVENKLDLLVLAEMGDISPFEVAREIGLFGGRVFSFVNPNSLRIKVFSAFGIAGITPLLDHQYFSAVRVHPPLGPDYILVGVHLPSKLNQEGHDQAIVAQRISSQIREVERINGNDKTVVLGDFNMNPFEHGLVNSDGFHAVMDRQIAIRGSRRVLFEQHPFFYNPMWGMHGDESRGPSGTYFCQTSSPICYFWNLFDQAIVRPSLLPYLAKAPVAVVEKIGNVELLTDGLPNREISDHLPITIFFKSENEVSNDD